MALKVLTQHNLLHKHGTTKELLETLTAGLLVILLATSMAVPHPALAFEADLAIAPAQKLKAPVRIADRLESDIRLVGEADYAERMANAVTGEAVIVAENRKATIKLAQANDSYQVTVLPVPTASDPMVLEGEASYYSRAGCLGCGTNLTMANGQPLNDNALTMAIGADKKHLVGHRATVTNLVTGLSVDVTITDTGGFYQAKYGSRVADLTIASKTAIGMYGGVGQVRVEVY